MIGKDKGLYTKNIFRIQMYRLGVYNMSLTMHKSKRKHIYLFSQEETPFVHTATHWITDIAATVPQMFNFILNYSSLILGQMNNSLNPMSSSSVSFDFCDPKT